MANMAGNWLNDLTGKTELLDTIEKLKQENQALTEEKNALGESSDALRADRDSLLQDNRRLYRDLTVKEELLDTIEKLKQENQTLTEEKNALGKSSDDLRADRDALRADRDSLLQDNQRLYYDLTGKKELLDVIKKLKQENQALTEEKDALGKNSDALRADRDSLFQDNQRLYRGNSGLMEEINFLKYRISTLDELHESVVQGHWPHDGSMKRFSCINPFTRVEILSRGEVYTCCSAYLKHNYYIGNIFDQDFAGIWNSDKVKNLRRSVLQGNFEYCMKACQYLHAARKNAEGEQISQLNPIRSRDKIYEEISGNIQDDYSVKLSPATIVLTCDESCNLSCPTCRSGLKVLNREQSDLLYERLISAVAPMLVDCETLYLLGSGDAFASSAVSRFMKTITHEKYPKLNMYLITNLQLLDRKKWEEFSNLKEIPLQMSVSVDAACKETYEKNRRGGSWERLLDNLTYLKQMRESHECKVDSLCLNMVVQENNFREMEDLIFFAERMDADYVELQRLGNWGTFADEEFKQRDVGSPDHPDHTQMVEMLRKIMKNDHRVKVNQNILDPEE